MERSTDKTASNIDQTFGQEILNECTAQGCCKKFHWRDESILDGEGVQMA